MYENIQKEFLKTMGKFYIVTLVNNRCQQINLVMFLTWSPGFQKYKNDSDFK